MIERLYYSMFSILSLGLAVSFVSMLVSFSQNPKRLPVEQLRSASTGAWNLLGISLVAGIASMAVVEVRKRLGRTRGYFHRRELLSRFDRRLLPLLGFQSSRRLITRLDIPLEQVVALLSAAAERAIMNPAEFGKLIEQLGGPRALSAAENIVEIRQLDEPNESALGENHAYLRQAIEQGLDSLQIELTSRWRYRLRLEASLIAGGIGLGSLLLVQTQAEIKLTVFLTTFVWGGFFAWLGRDIVAGIEKWRG
jgi:hypothetical protein